MKRTPRRKIVAKRKSRRLRGSSSNPNQEEERLVRPFPPNIQFRHDGQRNKFNQLMARPFVPMKYMSTYSF